MSKGKGTISPTEGVPFTKGDTRINRKGRPRKLPGLDRLLINTLGEKIEGTVAMEWILKSLLKAAINKGDTKAAQLLMDRAYGPLKQSTGLEIDIKNLSEAQVTQLIERLFKKEQNVKNITGTE